jgi:hypothetical protein
MLTWIFCLIGYDKRLLFKTIYSIFVYGVFHLKEWDDMCQNLFGRAFWKYIQQKMKKKIFANGFYASICDTIIALLTLNF